jgi:hypothetical protein
MECHHWISVWALAPRAQKPSTAAAPACKVNRRIMCAPEGVEID